MKQSTLLVFAALLGGTAQVRAQGLIQSIITPEKAVGVINVADNRTWQGLAARGSSQSFQTARRWRVT